MIMKINSIAFGIIAVILSACAGNADPVKEVNPFIGTALDGHTYPGATAPFGLVQLSPDTPNGGVAIMTPTA